MSFVFANEEQQVFHAEIKQNTQSRSTNTTGGWDENSSNFCFLQEEDILGKLKRKACHTAIKFFWEKKSCTIY